MNKKRWIIVIIVELISFGLLIWFGLRLLVLHLLSLMAGTVYIKEGDYIPPVSKSEYYKAVIMFILSVAQFVVTQVIVFIKIRHWKKAEDERRISKKEE